VRQAAGIVAAEADCSAGQAVVLLRERAEEAGTDLEDTALAVVARRISFAARAN
jgi:hypothetical protein